MRFKQILLLVVAACIGALALEVAARVFLPARSRNDVVPPEVGQFHDMRGWSPKPLSKALSNRTGYDIEYRINSRGMRDGEIPYDKPPGTFRIVVLGDSRTFGFGVPVEKHFTTILEGYFTNVEVINMGVDGYGVDQELLYLRSEGFRYRPDLVLAYVPHYRSHRHMHTERFGQQKPRFKLIDGSLVLLNSPVASAALTSPESASASRKVHRWLRENSNAYESARNTVVRLMEDQRRQPIEQQDEENLKSESFKKELFELGEAIVHAMHEESADHGATFVLVTEMEELHNALVERHVLSVNVARALANPTFPLPDKLEHINEAGNGVLAWEIAQYLEARHLIPVRYSSTQKPAYW